MTSDPPPELKFEIGHVLFIDIVGYSKLNIHEQSEQLETLKSIVRGTEQFTKAEVEGKLLRLPTGDGGALVFRTTPEAPVLCAIEVSKALKNHPELRVRMGIHSGPVNEITDLNEQANIAGAGINLAQRVMDCGDAGHILLSKHVADDLEHYPRWQPYLHSLGECEVKHAVRIGVVNLHTDEVGNPATPQKLRAVQQHRARTRWAAIAAALLLLGALVAAFIIVSQKSGRSTLAALEKSVAVLPLENLSDEKENAFFADGIQDELLSDLAKIKDLKVISRTSVMQYKAGITRNLKEIAQELGVSNIVEGSVRRSGNHMRVSMQLIDALTDRHIWAQNYDRTVADSVALQGELATQIASEVGATISPQEKARVEATPTKNTGAYEAYLRGRALNLSADPSNFEKAARSFQQAVTLDPNFALAWVYLSCADSSAYWNGSDPTPARLAAAKNALDRAVTLDPNLPETHLAVGYYRYYGLRDFTGALSEFQVVEKSLPNNVDVLRAIGWIQRRLAHWDEAIAAQRRAFELDPRSVDSAIILINSYIAKRRFSDAIAICDHILAVEPSNLDGLSLKMYCLWATGDVEATDQLVANPGIPLHMRGHQALARHRYPEAADFFSRAFNNDKPQGGEKRGMLLDIGLAQRLSGNVAASKAAYQQAVQEITEALNKIATGVGDADDLHSSLGIAYAGLGDASRAISEGKKGIELRPTSEDPFEGPPREEQMAQIYALLGDADEAIPILKKWIQVPSATDITPTLLRIDPIWNPIRNDPRFQELCQEK
jgi:TolB-like protein